MKSSDRQTGLVWPTSKETIGRFVGSLTPTIGVPGQYAETGPFYYRLGHFSRGLDGFDTVIPIPALDGDFNGQPTSVIRSYGEIFRPINERAGIYIAEVHVNFRGYAREGLESAIELTDTLQGIQVHAELTPAYSPGTYDITSIRRLANNPLLNNPGS